MNKKNIAIIVGVIIAAIIIVLLVLFGSKKEVTFDSVGGTEVATQEVRFFSKATKPADPTREGYVFDNWYLDDKEYDFDKRVTKDIKLVARWSKGQNAGKKFTVKFSTGEGSEVEPVEVEEDGTIKKPADPTREGYTFVAWQYNGKDFNFNTKVTKDMTLTAKWEKNSSTNQGTTTKPNTKPSKPNTGNNGGTTTKPDQPTNVTYSVTCERDNTSSVEQCWLRIKGSDGKNYNGKINVTTTTGSTGVMNANTPISLSLFKSGTVVSVN